MAGIHLTGAINNGHIGSSALIGAEKKGPMRYSFHFMYILLRVCGLSVIAASDNSAAS